MTRKRIFFTGCCVLLVQAITFLTPALAEDLDVDYAEHERLVADSLLLDVVRIGDRLVAAGERGHIVFSDDGRKWEQAEVVPTRSTINKLFVLEDRIWAAGHDSVILTSGDRGKTWTRQYYDPDRLQPIMDIYFADAEHGLAIGAYGLIMFTSDGGQTWEDSYINEEDDFHLNALVPFPDGRFLIAGEAGYSYRSFDNGQSWESLDMPYLGSMFGAIQTAEGCVLFYGLRGHVQKSCDFGENWEELETGIESSISDAAEYDGSVLLAGNNGALLEWDGDGGFTEHTHSSGVIFSGLIHLGDGRFLLVGEDGVHFYPESTGEEDSP
jgi:photosystem II stability/assembly factor-like uncharacterized protein